jgi:hypothetical protein
MAPFTISIRRAGTTGKLWSYARSSGLARTDHVLGIGIWRRGRRGIPDSTTLTIAWEVRHKVETASITLGEIPARDKCTVNGRNANGKPIAKATMRYVKNQ